MMERKINEYLNLLLHFHMFDTLNFYLFSAFALPKLGNLVNVKLGLLELYVAETKNSNGKMVKNYL